MKNLIAFALMTLASTALCAQEFTLLEGRYACKISYQEGTNISIVDGADFPMGSNLETPRTRSETLLVDFTAGSNPGATVVNPEALPNFLLINPSQAANQNSYVDISATERSVIYTIDWPQTWYFGSRVVISTVSAPRNGSVKVNLFFDDNDGWSQELDYVGCKKQ